MGRNGRCGRRCNGARSVSAIAVAVEKSPRPAYSRSPKPASGSSVTCGVTARNRYAAIAARLLHPLYLDVVSHSCTVTQDLHPKVFQERLGIISQLFRGSFVPEVRH